MAFKTLLILSVLAFAYARPLAQESLADKIDRILQDEDLLSQYDDVFTSSSTETPLPATSTPAKARMTTTTTTTTTTTFGPVKVVFVDADGFSTELVASLGAFLGSAILAAFVALIRWLVRRFGGDDMLLFFLRLFRGATQEAPRRRAIPLPAP